MLRKSQYSPNDRQFTPRSRRFNRRLDTLFLITHKSTFNISLQALLLIFQISNTLLAASSSQSTASKAIADRYYRTLYSSLQDPRLASSSKQAMYLNLLFKSIKADKNFERAVAFVRRFVQALNAGFGGGAEFTVGGLYLLGEVISNYSIEKSIFILTCIKVV
jgi:ribosome biogenesis protein MAK21